MAKEQKVFDCIVIGAGPGGLQGAINLARFNRKVLLIDQGRGRTRLAENLVNYLGIPAIEGKELTRIGFLQARSFGVTVQSRSRVITVGKRKWFKVETSSGNYFSPFVLAASGSKDIMPGIRNLGKFLGKGFYTCLACDGINTKGASLIVMGDSLNALRLAMAMKKMYTEDLTLLLDEFKLPLEYVDQAVASRITVVKGTPAELLGIKKLEGIRLTDGRELACQTVLADYGSQPNDQYLEGLDIVRDPETYRIVTDQYYETSVPGLFVTGSLRSPYTQTIIAAGEGATASIAINNQLLAF